MPPDRPIRSLRIYQVLPKGPQHTANDPRLGHANAESARMMLGTVPVETDGSAFFRVPARKPLYVQAVDAAGRAVQTMRSVLYLQPGERRSCLGCHETVGAVSAQGTAALGRSSLVALGRRPSRIRPGPDGTAPFSFMRLVQPILDRHCIRCHDGVEAPGRPPAKLIFRGEPEGAFSRSYNALRPSVRWYEWGGSSITGAVTFPGRGGADESRLTKVLADHARAGRARLSDDELQRLYIWLDGNVPFYGVYIRDQQVAQREGKAVPPPELQ